MVVVVMEECGFWRVAVGGVGSRQLVGRRCVCAASRPQSHGIHALLHTPRHQSTQSTQPTQTPDHRERHVPAAAGGPL